MRGREIFLFKQILFSWIPVEELSLHDLFSSLYIALCVSVCKREICRQGERERETETERKREVCV